MNTTPVTPSGVPINGKVSHKSPTS